jgi:TonB-dependent starch-binding outer membrane protein SusC
MSCRNLLRAFVLCAMLLLSLISFSQDKVISGKVSDGKDGSAMSGVTVNAKGTNNTTQTKPDGTFSITITDAVKTLVFSSVGFATQEVGVVGKTTVNVTLSVTNASLGEIVVVAYGTRRRGDLTGAVTSVSAKDFQKGNINSPEQLLQGKVAGLQITSGGGSAGGGSRIRIRGGASLNASNDPLIVIDGVPVEGNGIAGSANLLNTINPNDIESMSVLKDASATALYGSRASNGVIIITTKKGARGKVKFNYNTQLSVGMIGKTVDVLSGDQIRSIINADAAATGNNTYKNVLGTANTDWQDEIYQSAVGFDNTISASGSIGIIPFRASVGYLDQDGILKTDNFKRLSSSLNLSPKFFKDHLSVNVSIKASQTKNNFANGGAIGSAVSFDPTQPVFDNKNHTVNFGGYYEWRQANDSAIDLSTRNPVALLMLRNNTSKVNRIIGNVQVDYKFHFFPDLHVLLNLGIDNADGSGEDNISQLLATNYKTKGSVTNYVQAKRNKLADVSLFYTKEVKSIRTKLDVLVGHSYQAFLTKITNRPSYGQDGVVIPNSVPTFPTDRPEYRLESYIGRVNMTIADKYLLTASIRRDASSKFAKENRVGYFPSFAAAWKLREEFFKSVSVLSDLKLRLGWGKTGQQDGIGYYNYLPRYSLSNSSATYQFGNTYINYLRPEGYDPDLQWESTTTSNIGIDFGFLNNRISGSVDVYMKKTSDLLAEVTVAPGANFVNKLVTNVGDMENKGVEFTINTVPVKTANLTWELGFNYTYNKTEITNLLKNPDPKFQGFDVSGIGGGTGNTIGKFTIGYAPYVYNVYKQVYSKEGKPIEGLYEDINRDGIVNNDDRYLYKKPAADVLLGLNTNVTYKQFTIGLAAHGAFGNYLYNNYFSNAGVIRTIKNPINFIGNASTNYLETEFENNQYLSDYYIDNASFFRLDNINFGYNVGSILKNKATMRVNASIQNVFVITKYQGLDPENAGDSGVDGNIYPRPRVFSLGLNFDF